MKKALFPGSFDPFTLGHHAVLTQAIKLFDCVYVGIGINAQKVSGGLLSIDHKENCLKHLYKNNNHIKIIRYEGLTIDYCKNNGIETIIRGLRNASDFEYENTIAQNNYILSHHTINTVFVSTPQNLRHIHSKIVRDVYKNGADISSLVPLKVLHYIQQIL